LDHNNVCVIHEIDEAEDGQLFLAMACYEGETLKKRIERGPLPLDDALDITRQVAEGLAKAHERDIVHRDIKPANIFITNDGVVKILDFGLAKLSGQTLLTKTGTTLGTVAYMSPEQVRGEAAGPESDLWSLGVVLYEMLGGKQPFAGEHPHAVLYAISHAEPTPLTGISEEVEELVGSLLEKDLKKRKFPSASVGLDFPSASTKSRFRRAFWVIPFLAILVGMIYLAWKSKPPDGPGDFEGKSIAVVPFENLTGDPDLDIWTAGLPELIISELSLSPELKVLDRQTFMDVLEAMGEPRKAGIGLPVARDLASRADVSVLVMGSILKSGSAIRVQARLQDAKTGALIGTNHVEGQSEDDFFSMADSLAAGVRNDLELNALHEERGREMGFLDIGTISAAAYRNYIEGMNAFASGDYPGSIQFLNASLESDSMFVAARTQLIGAYVHSLKHDEARRIHGSLIQDIDRLPLKTQYELRAIEAYFNKDRFEEIHWFRKSLEANPQQRMIWYYLNMSHYFVEQYEEALACLDTVMDLSLRWGSPFHFAYYYSFYAESCLALGQGQRGIARVQTGLELFSDNSMLMGKMAALYLVDGDTLNGETWVETYKTRLRERGKSEGDILTRTGWLYAAAGDYSTAQDIWRSVIRSQPENFLATIHLAGVLIEQEIDVDEGIALLEGLTAKCTWCSSSLLFADYLGWGYFLQNRREEAVELLQKSWDESPFAVLKRQRRLELAKGKE